MRFKILHPLGERTFVSDTHWNIRVFKIDFTNIVLGQEKNISVVVELGDSQIIMKFGGTDGTLRRCF